MSFSFQSDGINLEYEIFGNGPKAMFAFHGFGNSADMFCVLESSLGKKYTVYSFNLPFHGQSVLDEETRIHGIFPVQLKKYFKDFLWHIHATAFSLIGYSIGGKVAMKLIELFPDDVRDVFLFAPDGIKVSFWYRLVTRTSLGKRFFKRLMKHPGRYLRFVDQFENFRLIHPRTANFVRSSLDTDEKRQMIYKTWMSLRFLDPDLKQIQKTVNRKGLDFHLFFGKYDKVIPPSIGERFVMGLHNKSALHILESGHRLVKEKINTDMERILSS